MLAGSVDGDIDGCLQLLPGQVESPEAYDWPRRSGFDRGKPQPRLDGTVGPNTSANEGEALRSALLDAGVLPDLVSQVLASYSGVALGTGVLPPPVLSARAEPKQVVDKSNASASMSEADSRLIPTASLLFGNASNHELLLHNNQIMSPFDLVMEKCVRSKQEENALLRRITSTGISTVHPVGALAPAEVNARATDCSPRSVDQVVAYTFGGYFARCVQEREDPDLRVRAIEAVDQYALVMKETIGGMVAFEGCVALISSSLEHSSDPRIFRASCQLACTLFEAMDEVVQLTPSTVKPTLDIVSELSQEHWLPGMARLLDEFLANDCCWSASVIKCGKQAQLSQPKTVNRYFLQWVRLLLQQSATQRAFLVVCSSTDDLRLDPARNYKNRSQTAVHTCAANKLRLLRLLLSNAVRRSAISDDVRERIAGYCRTLAQSSKHSDTVIVSITLQRLSKECMQRLAGQHSHDNPTTTNRGTDGTPARESSPKSAVRAHCPLFRKHPLSPASADQLSSLLRRYYDTRPRPPALYRHHFERCNVVDTDTSKTMSIAKGNIHFVGVIEDRDSPQSDTSFHDQLTQHTLPFVFGVPESHAARHGGQSSSTTVESPFSVFRGTVERRGVVLPPESRLPDIDCQSTSTHRMSRDAAVAAVPVSSRASSQRVSRPPPAQANDRLPALSVHTSAAAAGMAPTEVTASRRVSKIELPRKLSTAQVTEEVFRPTQAHRVPPRTAPADQQPSSPDKDACCIQ